MKLSEILQLNERLEQVRSVIIPVLKTGINPNTKKKFRSEESFMNWLMSDKDLSVWQISNAEAAAYSVAMAGDTSGGAGDGFILKISKDPNDPWRKFGKFCYESPDIVDRNPLFPRTMFYTDGLTWSKSAFAVVELLEVDSLKARALTPVMISAYFSETMRLLFSRADNDSNYQRHKIRYPTVDREIDKFMREAGFRSLDDVRAFGDVMKQLYGIDGWIDNMDLHGNNVGWRPNGDIVLFDPIG